MCSLIDACTRRLLAVAHARAFDSFVALRDRRAALGAFAPVAGALLRSVRACGCRALGSNGSDNTVS